MFFPSREAEEAQKASLQVLQPVSEGAKFKPTSPTLLGPCSHHSTVFGKRGRAAQNPTKFSMLELTY